MIDYRKLKPQGDRLLVELIAPATESAGGIFLPDTQQTNTTHGVVLAKGPGVLIPGTSERTPMFVAVGGEVLFPQNALVPILWTPELKIGVVRDCDLVGVVWNANVIMPANDWVMIAPEQSADRIGSIYLPQELIRSTNCGIVQDHGWGARMWTGSQYGHRLSVRRIMGLEESDRLIGSRVHWNEDADAFSLGTDSIQCVMVRARDLLYLEGSS